MIKIWFNYKHINILYHNMNVNNIYVLNKIIFKIKNMNVHNNNYFIMIRIIHVKIANIILIMSLKIVKMNHALLYNKNLYLHSYKM